MSWEILFILGTVVLGLGIALAMRGYARRNRRNDRVSERATHELYAHPERYEQTKRELEKQVEH